MISFYNVNGAQFEDENPYKILRDSQSFPGYFPECLPFTSSVNFSVKEEYDLYADNLDTLSDEIKRLIYEEGPILAMINRKFLNFIYFIYFSNKKCIF